MKKILTLTIVALLALFAIPTMVQAGNADSEATLISEVAGTDSTITLTGDIVLSSALDIGREVTIDLNGHSIEDSDTMSDDSLIIVLRGGELTIKDSVGTGKISATNKAGGRICVKMTKASGTTEPKAVLVVDSGTLEADSFAISGNGNPDRINTEIAINGGKIIGKNAAAIFHPQVGELIVNGGYIEGKTGIEMRSGSLEVNGGTIIGTGVPLSVTPNGSGTTTVGAGIAVAQHTTKQELNVAVNDGEIKGFTAVHEETPEANPSIDKISIEINGGEFKAINGGTVAVYSENIDKFITGGDFNQDVSKYVPAGYVTIEIAADLGLYRVKLNTPYVTGERVTVDDSLTGKIEIGIIEEAQGELNEIFEQEMEKNSKLKEALLDGKEVNIHVQMDKIEEKDINEKELKAMKKAVKEGKFVKFYDITLVMTADKTEKLGTITEISNKLTFKVLVPEELVKEGRTFFMYRYHDEKIEKLTGELDENNYFTFQSDRFSTYALAFEDKVDEPTEGGQGTAVKQPEKDETPKTGSIDVVLYTSAIIATISLAGIVLVKKYTK